MELNEKAKQELKKISELSSESAANALSQMISKNVSVMFPNFSLKPTDEIEKLEFDMILSICELEGDIRGKIVLAFNKLKILPLLDILMMQNQGTLIAMNEESIGAFNELNNIIGGAYVSAFANYLCLTVLPKPPAFIGDLSKSKSDLINNLNKNNMNILMINTVLCVESSNVEGMFLMLLENDSLTTLLDLLSKKKMKNK